MKYAVDMNSLKNTQDLLILLKLKIFIENTVDKNKS